MYSFVHFIFYGLRLKKQLSEMQSTSESEILQSIEVNSTRQQQAIQQVNVKFKMLYMISHIWNQLLAKSLWHNCWDGLGTSRAEITNVLTITANYLKFQNKTCSPISAILTKNCLTFFLLKLQQIKGETKSPKPLQIKVLRNQKYSFFSPCS